MDMVDHIEILRSPDSVLYGTGAIGGVTAVYTGWPADFTEQGMVYGGHGRVTLRSGGLDTWRLRGDGYVATPELRTMVGLTEFRSGDITAAGPQGTLHPTELQIHSTDMRFQ